MKRLLHCVITGLLATLSFPLVVLGEEGSGTVTLDEVVVSATKTAEKRKDVPNAVLTKDRIDIQESTSRGLGELVANEPGIDWRTYGNYGGAAEEIHIRGMYGASTQVFVNGVNVNSPSLGVADVGKIPLNNIDDIEIIKGSGSLLYGTGAMGGTVNILTKSPHRDRMDLRASAGYGSQDTYQLLAENGMFLTKDFGYYLTAGRKETDGFRDNSDLTHNDVSLKLVYDPSPLFNVSLYGDYIDREFGRPGVEPASSPSSFYARGVQVYSGNAASTLDRGGDEDAHLALQVASAPAEWVGLKLHADHSHMRNYNFTRYYDTWTGGVPGSETWTTNETSTVEGTIELKPFSGASLLLGADYRGYDWKNENVDLNDNGHEEPATRQRTTAHLYSKGAYAEAQYRPLQYVKAIVGARRERHSTFGSETIPRYGLIFNPTEKTALKLSHGKHFMAPTPNDLFWPFEDWGWGMGVEGNRNLKPETGWHTDATLEQSLFADKVFFTFSYFEWDINDKIRWIPDAAFFYRPQNLDTYEAKGWEAGAKLGPFYHATLSLSYTHTDAEERLLGGISRQALYTPDDQFKGSVTYATDFGLTVTATALYVGSRPGNYAAATDLVPTKTLEDYWTADLKLEQRIYSHWVITVQGNNLFDKGYETYASNFFDSAGTAVLSAFPGAGRFFFASLTFEFN